MGLTAAASRAVLVASGVSLAYHGAAVLRDVDLTVHAGELLGLIGPNGAGKSSLIKVLSGIARPAKGTVSFQGRPLEELRDRERGQQIAVMSQNPHAGFAYPVYDVVAMGRYPHKRSWEPLDTRDRRVIKEALETAGVAHLSQRPITKLSGGEKQRVFLARALAQEPQLLLLDEPTANLDVRYQLEIFALIRRLNQERQLTVVLAIHDLAMAMRFCDRLAMMSAGRLVAAGAPEDVLTAELVREVFGVEAHIERDPKTGLVRIDYVGVVS
jgi:ABC-type cobalamin/Fe3+-siderophores transport systems, ATPase components